MVVDTLSQSYSSQRVLYLLVWGCRLHTIKQHYYPLNLSNNSSLWHSTMIFHHSCSCPLHSITSRPSVCVQAVTTISRYFTKCCCQHKPARLPAGCFCHESTRFSKAEKWKTAHDCILSQTSLIRLATDYTLSSDFSAFKNENMYMQCYVFAYCSASLEKRLDRDEFICQPGASLICADLIFSDIWSVYKYLPAMIIQKHKK